jgi:putative endonuclease
MVYFVYILKCADDSLYTGITTDVVRRFKEHQAGRGGNYTSSHYPRKVVYTEKRRNRSQALKREAEIKSFPRTKKLALVRSGAKHP